MEMTNTSKKLNNAVAKVATAVLMIASFISSQAQEVCDSTVLYFRQSRSNIDNSLQKNKARLDSTLMRIRNAETSVPPMKPAKIQIVGGASPEGSFKFNETLSRKRADRIFDYFATNIGLPDSLALFSYLGRDWNGLKEMVEADPNVPSREDVLEILEEICNNQENNETLSNETLNKLKLLNGGTPYRYLYSKVFPSLRKSTLLVELTPIYPPLPEIETTESLLVTPSIDTKAFHLINQVTPPSSHKNFYMGLKTNMLYDIVAIPNLGVEFYLGKNWSITGSGMYGWWSKDSRHRYWRIYGGEIGVRRWFGWASEEKPLTGHHLGLYAGVFTYDFEWGGRGVMGGIPGGTLLDRCQYMAGVEYGYSLPIGRRFNIDFTIGLGYIGGKYLKYKPYEKTYLWQSTHRLNWFGPTKAEISLVWLIGNGNFNSKKGGLR